MPIDLMLTIAAWFIISCVLAGLFALIIVLTIASKGIFLLFLGAPLALIWALYHLSTH